MLICWALDRLTRGGAEQTLKLIRQFRERGVLIVSIQEPWLGVSPETQDVLVAFIGWVAQQESARRSERIKAGLARRKAAGLPVGRMPGAGTGRSALGGSRRHPPGEAQRERTQSREGRGRDRLPREQRQKDLEFLVGYDDRFLACRGDHHQWPQMGNRRHRNKIHHEAQGAGVVYIEMPCASCGRIRWKVIGRNAEPMSWRYKEPRGYKQPPGSGLIRSDYAGELQRRYLEAEGLA